MVTSLSQETFRDGSSVAIAIVRTPRAEQYHTGIVHKHAEANVNCFLHLRWNLDLTQEPALTGQSIVAINLNHRVQKRVAAKCRLVWRKNQAGAIPYGFASPQGAFDSKSGQYLRGLVGYGLTCSSFVLSVFDSEGIPLIDYADMAHVSS